MTWADLEFVIQSEVSQKEKNKYINKYIWNLEKGYKWTSLQDRNRDRNRNMTVSVIENEHVDTVGQGEWGELGE